VEAIIDDYSYNSTEVYTKTETDSTIESAISNTKLEDLDSVEVTTPSNGQVLTWNNTTHTWENDDAASGNTYLQTIEVWVSNGSASHTLAHTPSGAVTVMYEWAVQQRPYTDYTVTGDDVDFSGTTESGKTYSFSYIYY